MAGLLLELLERHPARVLDLRGADSDLVRQRGEPADDVAVFLVGRQEGVIGACGGVQECIKP